MEKIIDLALALARQAFAAGETPVAAVIFNTKTKQVLCASANRVLADCDPTAHAEVLAVRQAGKLLNNYNLSGYSIFTTVEPCAMCAAALSWAKIDKVYFGAYDVKSGAVENGPHLYQFASLHHKPEVYGGISEQECQSLMRAFFKGLREDAE